MQYEKYENVIASSDFISYQFISTGPKGNIPKLVLFSYTGESNIYNLAFGNKLDDDSIDDTATDNNKDRNKILATVVSTVYDFCKHYPDSWIFFTGSTPQRTRLYRMAIGLNYKELSVDFEILGILKSTDSFSYQPFEKSIDYFGFFIRRKKP